MSNQPRFKNTEAALRQRIAELEDERDDLQERVALAVPEEAENTYSALKEENRVLRLQLGEWQRKYENERRTVVALQKVAKRAS